MVFIIHIIGVPSIFLHILNGSRYGLTTSGKDGIYGDTVGLLLPLTPVPTASLTVLTLPRHKFMVSAYFRFHNL
jgi:hypothetical protein